MPKTVIFGRPEFDGQPCPLCPYDMTIHHENFYPVWNVFVGGATCWWCFWHRADKKPEAEETE